MLPKGLQQRGVAYYVQFKGTSARWKQISVGQDFGTALQRHVELRRDCDAPTGSTLSRAVERYLKRQETFSKATSIASARCSCGHLVRHFGARPISELR